MKYKYGLVLLLLSASLFAIVKTDEKSCEVPGTSEVKAVEKKTKNLRKIAQQSIADHLATIFYDYRYDSTPKRQKEIRDEVAGYLKEGLNPNTAIDGVSMLTSIGLSTTSFSYYDDKKTYKGKKEDDDKIALLLKTILDNSTIKVNTNAIGILGTNLLMDAALGVNGKAAALLIDYKYDGKPAGADLDVIISDESYLGWLPNPPSKGEEQFYIDFFQYIKEAGADINQPCSEKVKKTFAYRAAASRLPKLTEGLIDLGMNFNTKFKNGYAPIIITLYSFENVRLMIEKGGVDITGTFTKNRTLLQVANKTKLYTTEKGELSELNKVIKYLEERVDN